MELVALHEPVDDFEVPDGVQELAVHVTLVGNALEEDVFDVQRHETLGVVGTKLLVHDQDFEEWHLQGELGGDGVRG